MSNRSSFVRVLLAFLALGAALAPAPGAAVAQQGTITGRVVDAANLEPLATVQVFLPGLNRGTLSDATGRFVLQNVPVGSHEVRAQRIGYRTTTRSVSVAADQSAALDFSLEATALALDEVVVTGTAGQTRRRELGNTIAQLEVVERVAPALNTDNLLEAAAPGIVMASTSSGRPGGGGRIRLRGIGSMSQGNQPLVFIDGVKMHNSENPENIPLDGSPQRNDRVNYSAINDINPEDIERIEVIKGAAATTLYGTEASAGVIQIFTKRGAAGAPVWTMDLSYGIDETPKFMPEPEPYFRSEVFLRTGQRKRVAGTVSGGSNQLRYFISSAYEDNTGVLPNDAQGKFNLRGNFSIELMPSLHVDFNSGLTKDDQQQIQGDSRSPVVVAIRDRQSTLGPDWRERWRELLDWDIGRDIDHFVSSLTTRHTPTENLSNEITVGLDHYSVEMRNVQPFGMFGAPLGVVNASQYTRRNTTLNWVTNYVLRPFRGLSATLSGGAQTLQDDLVLVAAYGDNLAGPGLPTVSSAARRLGGESRQRVVTGGLFGQVLLGLRERYFLTLGLRVDGNSAFGEDFGLQPYPKASLSYVLSEEAFWPDRLGEMKLRFAYGQAGKAPGAFDATRTWEAVGFGGQPAFYPGAVGNPDLGPERTTELEYGFDAGLLDGRATLEVTRFDQKVTEALVAVPQIPSNGFAGTQLMNLGVIENNGYEVALNATLLSWGSVDWSAGVTYATSNNEIVDLGGAPESTSIREGHPIGLVVGTKLLNPDEFAEPEIDPEHLFGSPVPTTTWTVSNTLELPYGIVASARGEYQGGHFVANRSVETAASRRSWPECEIKAYDYLANGRRDELTAKERFFCDPRTAAGYFADTYPADFFKLRELSIRAPLPTRGILGDAHITLSGRNLWAWYNDDWQYSDPEAGGARSLEAIESNVGEALPLPRSYTISIRTTF